MLVHTDALTCLGYFFMYNTHQRLLHHKSYSGNFVYQTLLNDATGSFPNVNRSNEIIKVIDTPSSANNNDAKVKDLREFVNDNGYIQNTDGTVDYFF